MIDELEGYVLSQPAQMARREGARCDGGSTGQGAGGELTRQRIPWSRRCWSTFSYQGTAAWNPGTIHLRTGLDVEAALLTSWHCFNRMIGQLYHCLQHRQLFDEHTAFPTELVAAA
ncbi:hypothetical protein [Streptomyces sp. MBT65]|uniref:hypothetical protein n=1 Tax=Streptomyces sp. MBT65 TaxID=1488395 RepID=UPI0035AF5EB0